MDDHSESRNPVEVLAEDFTERRRRGDRPTVAEYADAHPELADQIRQLFPAIVAMERVKRDAVSSGDRPFELRVDKLEQLGDYRILREIGRGGMGIVYEAEQQSLGRRVAVKVFPRQALGDSKHLQRFRREARTAALLHHSNIVQVFGVGDQDGLSYYVMQLIRGVGLDKVIGELRTASVDGCPPPAEPEAPTESQRGDQTELRFVAEDAARAVLAGGYLASDGNGCYWHSVARIGIQVGEALSYAHAQGTLHRDIKPANLLLDSNGRVWVTDFGLAKVAVREQLSQSGDIVGTLRYMAPEQLEGQHDSRSDVYSLGLTLYELVTLQPAFVEADHSRLMRRVSEGNATRPRSLRPDVPRDLETIVLKAIARDPQHRYQTAGELVDDLRRLVEDRPIRARRVRPAERLWRWSRRNPTIAILSTVLLLVMTSSFATVSWKWREAEMGKRRAREENRRAEANLSLALDSMDRFLDRFESTWMAHPREPQGEEDETGFGFRIAVSPSTAAVLEDALEFYHQFAEQNALNPRLQRDTADAHRRVGDIHRRLGQYDKAEDVYGEAAAIYAKQMGQFPNDPNLATLTAATLNELGLVLQRVGRLEDARSHFERAKGVLSDELNRSPQSSECRYELARAFSNLGGVSWRLMRPVQAAHNRRQAKELLETLAEEHPQKAEYRLALARAYRVYVPFPTHENRGQDAAWYRSEAISILEKLVADFPEVPDYQCELSETIAISSRTLHKPEGAEEVEPRLRRAVELAGRLSEEYPRIPRYRAALASSVQRLGWLLRTTDRSDEAEPEFRQAATHYRSLHEEFPSIPAYRFFLAMALHSHGDVLRDLERLEESRQVLELAVVQQQGYLESRPETVFGKGILAGQKESLAATLEQLGETEQAARAAQEAEEIRESLKRRHRRR
jgi:serine/threonine protein kinase